MRGSTTGLSELARWGFAELSLARQRLAELAAVPGIDVEAWSSSLRIAADPDRLLYALAEGARREPELLARVLADEHWRDRVFRVLGVSGGIVQAAERRPELLEELRDARTTLPTAAELGALITVPDALTQDEVAATAELRRAYRRGLIRIVAVDAESTDPASTVLDVAAALSDAASAALEAAVLLARHRVTAPDGGAAGCFPAAEVALTRFTVIGMGKLGARELNYLSDVDVIFVAESADEEALSTDRALKIATRIAQHVMRILSEPAVERELWEVDANLRPEGRKGALVRTLSSHISYYERWAKSWEFQALLKARTVAGDAELGAAYERSIAPFVWTSASRESFVESVQHMRERVTEHIPEEQRHHQLKLGPGGLRDVEFTVQLLQLVHGQTDESVRAAATVDAVEALAVAGYIGRDDAAELSASYRLLRLLEHRIQLDRLRRTHLMPQEPNALRVLARATGLAETGEDLVRRWERVKGEVRGLHLKLFYRPLLSAVAALPEEEARLSPEQAAARLQAIGFRDARGALGHIQALTRGVSRGASIQRHLLPVLLRWFADGTDPDYGLLAFRRLSDALGSSPWFLRMLRDSSVAAERLTGTLSSSRFIGELLDQFPEAAAWLEDDRALAPQDPARLGVEFDALLDRHVSLDRFAAAALRLRRRETLRLALASVLGLVTIDALGTALSALTDATIEATLRAVRREDGLGPDALEFAIIAMGRWGGAELGFGSDADLLYVYRAPLAAGGASRAAARIVQELRRVLVDTRVPLELDAGLRPEGQSGPLVRSFDAYRAYYERWSLGWEAQALLRARPVAGDTALAADMGALADEVRYPREMDEAAVREIRRIKARVENERLPQGADPARHLKLGRGSLSDVEWCAQLLQMRFAAVIPGLRTPHTRQALTAAADAGLLSAEDAESLDEAWLLASRVRSANVLWTNRRSDVLPTDREQLEAVARILGYPPRSASELEEDYLRITRRARTAFEASFYGIDDAEDGPSTRTR